MTATTKTDPHADSIVTLAESLRAMTVEMHNIAETSANEAIRKNIDGSVGGMICMETLLADATALVQTVKMLQRTRRS